MGDLKSDQAKILRDFDSAEISSETVSHCFLAQLDSPDTAALLQLTTSSFLIRVGWH